MTDPTESTEAEPDGPLLAARPDSEGGAAAELGLDHLERNAMWRHAARKLFGEDAVADEPATIGSYVIEGRIGAGGMGVVYHARDPKLGRSVAIKLLHPKYVGHDDRSIVERRMWREAQAMARLNHPNVVQIHEVGTHGEQLFLAMEYVDGVTLGQWIEDHRPNQREVLALFGQAGEGLARAHAVGLVHRDFKPDNVLVGAGPVAKVTDFGLVGALEADLGEDAGALTATGARLGTPYYMAPEQYETGVTDARADQFSYCVALWEALCGQRPFAGKGFLALRSNILDFEIVEPPRGRPLPGWLRQVLERGLQPDPARRYPSLDQLLAALRSDPTRRRWYVGGGSVVMAAAGVIYADRVYERARQIDDCTARGQEIHEIWTEDRRATAREALVENGDTYAYEAVDRALEQFDAWAEDWSASRSRACREHDVDGTREAGSYAKALDCLEAQRLFFEVQVDILSKPRESGLFNAVHTASLLRRQLPCLDEQALLLAPEVDPTSRHERDEIYAALARSHAALLDVNSELGLQEARRARALAEASGIEALVASAWHQEGMMLAAQDRLTEAVEANGRAFDLAGTSGAIEVAISAATALVWDTGVALEHFDEAHAWARIAALLIARSGLGESWIAARRLSNEAELHKTTGQLEQALELETAALQLHQRLGDQWGIARSSVTLAGIFLELGQLAKAEAMFERALAIRQQLLGPEHPKTIQTIINMGTTYIVAGRYSEARIQIERALEQFERVLGPDDTELIAPLLNLGTAQLRSGADQDAIETWRRARTLVERTLGPRHSHMGLIDINLAGVYYEREDYARAVPLYEEAVEIMEQLHGPEYPQANVARTDLGQALIDDDPQRAQVLLEQAYANLEAALGRDAERTVHAASALGKLAMAQGDPPKAQQHYEHALKYWEAQRDETGGVGRPELGDALRDLARAHRAQGRHDEARALLERALVVYEGGSPPDVGRSAVVRERLASLSESEG